MHADDRVPILRTHFVEDAVAQDASIVHDDIDSSEAVERRPDDSLRARPLDDTVPTDRRLPAFGADRGAHLVGGACIRTLALDRGPARTSVVTGQSVSVRVDLGWRRVLKQKPHQKN